MKRILVFTLLSATALALSACGAQKTSSTSGASEFRNNSALRNRPLSPEAKLALGTIKLEGTPEAVDASQAARLLPLWQLMAQLNKSTSTAPQEVTAVMDEIQAGMDPAQVKAIDEMQLTAADVFSSFQQGQGTSGSAADPGGASQSTGTANHSGQRGGVFFGGGGFPGGGGFGGAVGANRNATTANGANTAASAAQAAQQFSNQISTVVVNQLVQLLEARLKS